MKLRFIVLFLLLLFCMLVTSVSYAWTIDDFFHYTRIVHDTPNISVDLSAGTQKILNNETNIRNMFNQHSTGVSSITCGIYYNAGNPYYTIYLAGPYNMSINSSRCFLQASVGKILCDSTHQGNIYWSSGSSNSQQYPNNCYGLLDSTQTIPSQYFINNYWVPPYTGPVFTPSNNGTITVYNSLGVSEQFIRLPFYVNGQNDWTLGYLTDYDEVYAINGYFGPYAYSSGDGNIVESYLNTFNYDKIHGTYTKNLYFDKSTGRISIDKRALLNKQGYNLYLNYQLNYGDDNGDTIYEGNYYSYYGNLFISSGDLISDDFNTSIDIAWINSFGDLINDNQNSEYIVNNSSSLWFSGDLVSGDLFGVSYRNYDKWGLGDFVFITLMNFYNLLVDYSNVSINMGMLGVWNSADFVLPSNALTAIFSLIANGLLVLYGVFFLFRLVNAISTFDIDNITSTDDIINLF